jgi:hypothetical protein
MPSLSLSQSGSPAQTTDYSIKEFQLIVRDAPAIPAEIQPFVGIQYRSSLDVYQAFRQLSSMPAETFLVLHLDGKNRMVGMTTCSIGSMTASLVHPREVFRPAIANLAEDSQRRTDLSAVTRDSLAPAASVTPVLPGFRNEAKCPHRTAKDHNEIDQTLTSKLYWTV